MLSVRRQQENLDRPTKVVKVTAAMMTKLVQNRQVQGLIPATLAFDDAGQMLVRSVLKTINQ